MKRIAVNIIAALAFGLVLAYVGPRLDEIEATTKDAVSAQQTAQHRARFERAAQAMCGENAGWVELGDSAIQCKTKRGHNTLRASL